MKANNSLIAKFGIPLDDVKTLDLKEQLLFEKNNMTFLNLDPAMSEYLKAMPRRIYCNKNLVLPLKRALTSIIEKGLHTELKTFDGCYNVRPVRGYEKEFKKLMDAGNVNDAATFLSTHSWGMAVDFNAAWNKLGAIPMLSKEFVSCFKKEGFKWRGEFSRKDGMHFQIDLEIKF
jgi:hypothetical protein